MEQIPSLQAAAKPAEASSDQDREPGDPTEKCDSPVDPATDVVKRLMEKYPNMFSPKKGPTR